MKLVVFNEKEIESFRKSGDVYKRQVLDRIHIILRTKLMVEQSLISMRVKI